MPFESEIYGLQVTCYNSLRQKSKRAKELMCLLYYSRKILGMVFTKLLKKDPENIYL